MKKQMLMAIVMSFFIFSCNETKNIYSESNSKQENILSESFYGNWQLCKSRIGNRTRTSNICQTWTFSPDGSGKSMMGDTLLGTFSWKIHNKNVKISFDNKVKDLLMSGNGNYNFKIYSTENLNYLEISSLDNENIYFLCQTH